MAAQVNLLPPTVASGKRRTVSRLDLRSASTSVRGGGVGWARCFGLRWIRVRVFIILGAIEQVCASHSSIRSGNHEQSWPSLAACSF